MKYRHVRRNLPVPRPKCPQCASRTELSDMMCEGCADERVAEAQPDIDDANSVVREQYARTLAEVYWGIRRGQIDDALDRLDRKVLAELDSAWRTLV